MSTFSNVLDTDLVTEISSDYESRIFRIQVGTLATEVTIKIGLRPNQIGRYTYSSSHAIKTPKQLAPYNSNIFFGDTPEDALAKAIDDLTFFYRTAERAGCEPDESWLVPNRSTNGM